MNQVVNSGYRTQTFTYMGILMVFLVASLVSLSGCSSTKVYANDKTLVYGSDIYNLGNVQRLGSRMEAKLPNGESVNTEKMDKKAVTQLLKTHQSLLMTSYIEFDDKDMVYKSVRVKSYSDYSKMISNRESAMKSIRKFMANKKSRQLKLK